MGTVESRQKKISLSDLTEPRLTDEDGEDFRRGVVLFNSGQFWESHEAWEQIWKRHPETSRIFFQGLIQVAAALHQLQRGIFHGVDKHLRNAVWKLRPFQPAFLGLNVQHLVTAIERCHADLDKGRIPEIRERWIPKIKIKSAPKPEYEN
jgi:hypothetical protein